MSIRKLSRFLLVLPLLVSALSLTPAQAAGLAQAADDAKVIWCPATVLLPTPKQNGCTDAFPRLVDLWNALVAKQPTQAGTIWLGKSYNTDTAGDGNQLFSGAVLTKMAKYPLTFKGGWNGLRTGTLDPTHPSTFVGASLEISAWQGSVTVRNLDVELASSSYFCPAAVCVITAGSIKLDRVTVHQTSNSLEGAHLENILSVSSPPGFVTVTNSKFSNANGDGLHVLTKGIVTITNVWAEENMDDGADVNNTAGAANVLLKGTNIFLGNESTGLVVLSKGNVTASNLAAYDNGTSTGRYGVYIDNQTAATAKAVTISGSVKVKGNGYDGLNISTKGPITAYRVTAIANRGDGLLLTSFAPADTLAISLAGVNADDNIRSGIVLFADGKLKLTCSSAYSNNLYNGLYVRGSSGDPLSTAAALTLQGFSAYANGNLGEDTATQTPVVHTACP